MHKIMENVKFGNVKPGFFCICYLCKQWLGNHWKHS